MCYVGDACFFIRGDNNMNIKVPEQVRKIISKLKSAGYEAYAVGGCVRDSFMGTIPHDWDICTSALPEETLNILSAKNIIQNGLKHGTVTVSLDHNLYEITTFRKDGTYADCRHPDNVTFVNSLHEDLARRDFTINAMAYDPEKGVFDYFGGISDIENKVIRCVGDPDKRFSEDALRILRALRFVSKLGFTIEKNTAESAVRNAFLLKKISVERISEELIQILNGDYVEMVLTDYIDILSIVIPEIVPMVGHLQYNPHHIYDIWQHTIKVVVNSPKGKVFRLAALFHDIAKPQCFTLDEKGIGHFHGHPEKSAEMAREIMNRLKLDNKTINSVVLLIKYHDRRPPADVKNVRKMISKIGKENFLALLKLKRADAKGQNPATIEQKLSYTEALEKLCYQETKDGTEYNLKTLAVNGNDIINLGVTEGKCIGAILKYLLDSVIGGVTENKKEELLLLARKYLAE